MGAASAGQRKPEALGLVTHTGWAHAVAITLQDGVPLVLLKQRLPMWGPVKPGEDHLYHRAADLPLDAARRALAADEREGRRVSAASFRKFAQELITRGYRLVAVRLVDRIRRPLPPLETVLASHPLLHAAEGLFFRRVLVAEAGKLIPDTAQLDGDDLPKGVAKAARLSTGDVAECLARAGKSAGRPWTQEHRLCALAGWLALLARK
jgi:hypothetical protein